MSQAHDSTNLAPEDNPRQRFERLASIGSLAGGIAHELNNLLGGILMAAQYAGSALDRPEGREIVVQALADIATDAQHGSEIVADVLRFARSEPGERTTQPLAPLLEEAIKLATKAAVDNNARVIFEAGQELPHATVDRVELRQAMSDLVSSALSSGASQVQVHAVQAPSGRGIRISVHDDGRPLSEAEQEGILEPLYTLESVRPGARLGLALAHAIVVEHGGAVDVASSPSEGTIVAVELPLARETD